MAKCKSCGAPLIYAVNDDGKQVALTPTVEVYKAVEKNRHGNWTTKRAKQEVYVNHRLVCAHFANLLGAPNA